ncbi:hypothetical protein [Streptomyces sp. NPDC096012]|uniref:hypothetical protein n=1 Tax=Streptomyces sp. NPDC096012 TaxID=3155684 RepID=UPI00336AE1FF
MRVADDLPACRSPFRTPEPHASTGPIAALFELPPPLDSDADEARRTQLVTRFGTVRPFLKLLATPALTQPL